MVTASEQMVMKINSYNGSAHEPIGALISSSAGSQQSPLDAAGSQLSPLDAAGSQLSPPDAAPTGADTQSNEEERQETEGAQQAEDHMYCETGAQQHGFKSDTYLHTVPGAAHMEDDSPVPQGERLEAAGWSSSELQQQTVPTARHGHIRRAQHRWERNTSRCRSYSVAHASTCQQMPQLVKRCHN
ncbi:hypothetical protein EYF80_036802 [Liparis tanakae]|uniref:Uncharacterized protein n=1 Tax=Liparis tanakae TaxID=230148 RepID=A0A4Z2GJE0_9TELE|nr:hypothetical protein EYF80_036802 [Liparis tanakae]